MKSPAAPMRRPATTATDATDDDASCTYADPGLNCDGSCIDDTDGDGICDGDESPRLHR